MEKELTQRELSKLQPPPQVGGAHECLQGLVCVGFSFGESMSQLISQSNKG